MNERFAQSLVDVLIAQRDQAMNLVAQTEARLRVVTAELEELKAGGKKAKAAPEGPLSDKVIVE